VAPTAASTPPSVAIVTLGCGRNEVDSDQLGGLFHREGCELVDDPASAEVVLVNTCTFIAPAKQESIDTVLEACQLKEDGVTRGVFVVGCMAQRYPRELAEAIPEADAIVGFDGYGRLPAIVSDVLEGRISDRIIGVGAPHPGSRPSGRDLPLLLLPSGTTTDDADTTTTSGEAPAAGLLGLEVRERGASGVTGPSARGPASAPVDELTSVHVHEPTSVPGDERTWSSVEGRSPGRAGPPLEVQDDLDRMPASGPRFPVRRLGVAGPPRPWSYLKIASGCDRVCTFCAIPSFRGRFRSRPLDEIVSEAVWLSEQGIRELVLVSENTTSWGKDLPAGRDLQPTLLRELSDIDGLERIRLMYLQPAELTEPLLQAIATEPKVASYYDLSLQHVSGPVVRRMGRSGDGTRFAELIARARDADPDAVFRSNFIVGFPGETDDDVRVLEDFLEEQRLDWVGFFPFSREDGTPSDHLDGQVPDGLVRERLARVGELQERVADAATARFVGRELDVLVDEVVEDDPLERVTLARSYREAPDTDGEVALVGPDGAPAEVPAGRWLTVRAIDAVGVDLVAEVDAATAGGARG
jgi:ribosomal protein S12 methylthiotransferase